ncbi:family 16 glycoside hydrolase [Candidatus Poribacteria bacterium]
MQLRKRFLYIFSALLLIFMGQAMAGEWTDEFDDEDQIAEDWTPLFGTWKFLDGKYRMEAGALSGASITQFDTNDATSIEISAAYVDGGWENFSIILAYIDGSEAYQLDIRGGGGAVRFEKFTPGVAGSQVLAQGNMVAARNVWYTLKVVIEGDTVIGFVDDAEIVRYTFPGGLPEGKIGLGGEQSNTEFEYITIIGPRIGFEAVDMTGKLTTTWAGIKSL